MTNLCVDIKDKIDIIKNIDKQFDELDDIDKCIQNLYDSTKYYTNDEIDKLDKLFELYECYLYKLDRICIIQEIQSDRIIDKLIELNYLIVLIKYYIKSFFKII
jgi:hypothetical protein